MSLKKKKGLFSRLFNKKKSSPIKESPQKNDSENRFPQVKKKSNQDTLSQVEVVDKVSQSVMEQIDEEKEDIGKKDCKVVMVGDGGVGKTCLVVVYNTGDFPEDYVPTIFDNYKLSVKKDWFGKGIEEKQISVWDTAGQEDYDYLLSLSYTDADVFIICFSVTNPTSLKNVKKKWLPAIKKYAKNSKYKCLLVGTKVDLRKDDHAISELSAKGMKMLQYEDGENLADELGCIYRETSAKKNEGVKVIFETSIKLFMKS